MRTQRQVIGKLDHLAGSALGKAARDYRDGVLAPVIEAIEGMPRQGEQARDDAAVEAARLLKRFGLSLLGRMDSTKTEERIADALAQSGAIGVVASMPANEVRSEK